MHVFKYDLQKRDHNRRANHVRAATTQIFENPFTQSLEQVVTMVVMGHQPTVEPSKNLSVVSFEFFDSPAPSPTYKLSDTELQVMQSQCNDAKPGWGTLCFELIRSINLEHLPQEMVRTAAEYGVDVGVTLSSILLTGLKAMLANPRRKGNTKTHWDTMSLAPTTPTGWETRSNLPLNGQAMLLDMPSQHARTAAISEYFLDLTTQNLTMSPVMDRVVHALANHEVEDTFNVFLGVAAEDATDELQHSIPCFKLLEENYESVVGRILARCYMPTLQQEKDDEHRIALLGSVENVTLFALDDVASCIQLSGLKVFSSAYTITYDTKVAEIGRAHV